MTGIRLATPADAEELARLRYTFRASVNEPVEPAAAFIPRCASWMSERLVPESSWRCWVAERKGTIVGHLWLYVIGKIPNPADELELHGYITNVFVTEEARGAGLGARLIEAATQFCGAAGVDSVILWPTSRSRPLYARHGFSSPEDMLEAVLDHARDLH